MTVTIAETIAMDDMKDEAVVVEVVEVEEEEVVVVMVAVRRLLMTVEIVVDIVRRIVAATIDLARDPIHHVSFDLFRETELSVICFHLVSTSKTKSINQQL